MIELLSPAGEIHAFKTAIENGCNAIYMGIKNFNARAMANNFEIEEYIELIKYAHIRDVKVYLTLNTLLKDDEIKQAMTSVITLYSHGLDAVIIQDIGMFKMLHEILPNLAIHASTQMSIHNLSQVNFFEKIGFKRIVLARELTIDEIKYIKENSNIELEVFIHGALCMSVSGQCLLSSVIGSRSANRGLCAAPCRMKYRLYKNDKILTSNSILSKKDIFGIEDVQALINIGVTSLKIEGRNKSSEYVGLVTNKYRKYIDKNQSLDKQDEKELLQMFNRSGKSYGYLRKVEDISSITLISSKNTGLKLGNVIDIKDMYIKIKLEQDISLHDGIEVYSNNNIVSTVVTCIKSAEGKLINNDVDSGNIVYLGDIKEAVELGSVVYKTSSNKLNINYRDESIKRKKDIYVDMQISSTSNIKITCNFNIQDVENNINFEYPYIPEISRNVKSDDIYINEILNKNVSPFNYNLNINMNDDVYIPISVLNSIRKEIETRIIKLHEIVINVENELNLLNNYIVDNTPNLVALNNNSLSAYVLKYDLENIEQYNNYDELYINITDIYNNENILENHKKIYIVIPNVVYRKLDEYINNSLDRLLSKADGIVLGNIGYLELCNFLKSKHSKKIILDYSLNIYNSYSLAFFMKYNIDKIILQEMVEGIDKLINVQIPSKIFVMTNRFCIIKSFDNSCNTKDNFHFENTTNSFNILCDNVNCVSKIYCDNKVKSNLKVI